VTPPTSPGAPAPARIARARTADLLVFGVNGFGLASWLARVPDIKQSMSLSPGQLGLLLFSVSVGALLGLPLAGRVAHRFGAERAVRIGALLAMPGLMLTALAVHLDISPWLLVPGLVLVGLGNGVWDVAQNLEGTVIEQALGRAIMPWFHAAFSAGTVLAALIGALLVHLHVAVALHITVVAVLALAVVWWGTAQFLPAYQEPEGEDAAPRPVARSAWLEPRTLLIGLMVLAAAFTEGTANDWMAVAFVEGHGLSKSMGVVALSVFLTFMTAGRILGTGLLNRYGRVPVLRILFGSALVGCALVVFGTPALAFLGAAIWGLGASLGFPVGMSAASDDPARAHARLSVVATIGYTAFLAGPPLLGFLGDHVGVLRALLVVGVVSLLALLVIPAARPLPADLPTTEPVPVD